MYRIQVGDNDCGPVAIWNAYEYASKHKGLHYKEYRKIFDKMVDDCKLNDDYGTYPWVLYECLVKSLNGKMVIPKRPTYKKEKMLNEYEAFILLYSFEKGGLKDGVAHYVFCTRSSDGGTFRIYNYYDPVRDVYSNKLFRKEEFEDLLMKSVWRPLGLDYPQAWCIRAY